ncbi:hypothetical protein [Saccharothrix variisporea]|uniref:Uncharacterized protein n=1 Tax=Saccharothrix variisporea TaxID=543527 RepID=A0A495XQ57_9PSEU|nr:hypothetical protein [Saccharothrix variisporea]RKT74583.1 hypothetical protein DFJ66_7946 [Saccharothrix variisporea]
MGLTEWLLRRTPPRPFVVAAPGGPLTRIAVERFCREHGWWPARSAAEANLLVVAGPANPELEPYLDRVWDAIPAPRARADIAIASDVPEALTEAVERLRDVPRQRAETARAFAEMGEGAHEMSCGSGMPDQHDHHGHDMSGMEMPGGMPMADRDDDRDGLKLDVLHVPLGPALPDWPEGLVVHTVLQGDVIQSAEVEQIGHSGQTVEVPGLVHRLDSAARLLSVAGWRDAANTARRLRDQAPAGAPGAGMERWAERVRRSRTLRWTLAGVGEHDGGDALTRLYGWLAGEDSLVPLEVLPRLLVGRELAEARLVVASAGRLVGEAHAHG